MCPRSKLRKGRIGFRRVLGCFFRLTSSDCCSVVLSIAGRGSVCLRVTFTQRLEDLLTTVACFQFSLSDIAVTVQFDKGSQTGTNMELSLEVIIMTMRRN